MAILSAVDSFLPTGAIGGFTFAIAAAESCPRTHDPNKNAAGNCAPCAISATATVVTAVLTGGGYSGDESSQAKSNGKVPSFAFQSGRPSCARQDRRPRLHHLNDQASFPHRRHRRRVEQLGHEYHS